MNLNEYLSENNLTREDASKIFGVTAAQISHICTGFRKPSPKLAKKIQTVTLGKVTILELLYPEDYRN